MKLNKKMLMAIGIFAALLVITAATQRPQLSFDEQQSLVETIKGTVAVEVEADIAAKLRAAGYIGFAAALEEGLDPEVLATAAATPEAAVSGTAAATETTAVAASAVAGQPTPTALNAGDVYDSPDKWDSPADYWEGAVLQPDGTYRGLHAKFIYGYGYGLGEDENGNTIRTSDKFIPNQRYNVDVVFENDGSVVWPPRIEMRHTGNNGEYTGHQESVISDRTMNPVKPGDRAAFTVSAHGSENIGDITFYFKLYDADSGSAIEGGDGSFFYHAVP